MLDKLLNALYEIPDWLAARQWRLLLLVTIPCSVLASVLTTLAFVLLDTVSGVNLLPWLQPR